MLFVVKVAACPQSPRSYMLLCQKFLTFLLYSVMLKVSKVFDIFGERSIVMENVILVFFGIFLLTLIALDLLMIISLLRTGDERRQFIVWKASAFTLLVVVGTLVIDVVESIVRVEVMLINPFIRLSVTAMVYLLTLLYYKKRYGD